MVQRNVPLGVALMTIVCLVLIGWNQKEIVNYRNIAQRYQQQWLDNEVDAPTASIWDVVARQRNVLINELSDYKFPEGKNVEDFTPVTGGRPLRTVIITSWRSGSTFLGEIFNLIPGNFYHYEPLLEYGIVQIREPPLAESALFTLESLLNCDYTSLDRYLSFGMSHPYLFTHNTRLWSLCELYPQYCWDANFLNIICKVFPFQSMKTVRLRLRLAEGFLRNEG